MEHVFYKCHEKIGRFFLSKTTHRTRSIIEHAVMIMAVCSVSTVLVCHYSFVYRGQSQQPIISSSTSNNVVKNEYNNINRGNGGGGNIPMCLRNIKGWKDNMEITHVLIRNIERSYVWDSSDHKKGDEINNCLAENLCHINSNNITEPLRSRSDLWFSYSQTKGLLLLPESVQKEHAFSYQYLVISPFDPKCFGDPALQHLIYNIMTPKTVIKNWFISLHNGDGFLFDGNKQEIIDLHYFSTTPSSHHPSRFHRRSSIMLYKIGILFSSIFLFFMTTTLASFVLLETQDRMLTFTFMLQAHVQNRMPTTRLVFRHLVESLVFIPIMLGVLVFLMEFVFFGDTILGFGVFSMVWVGEVFSVICMRTRATIHFFPRVFFLYFTLFHIYFFSCPFGFATAALLSTCLLLLHAMVFFWNRYELPALEDGIINANSPRAVMHTNFLHAETESQQHAAAAEASPTGVADLSVIRENSVTTGSNISSQTTLTHEHVLGGIPIPRYPSNRSLMSGRRNQNGQQQQQQQHQPPSYIPSMSGNTLLQRVNSRNSVMSTGSRGSLFGTGPTEGQVLSSINRTQNNSLHSFPSQPSSSIFYQDYIDDYDDNSEFASYLGGEVVTRRGESSAARPRSLETSLSPSRLRSQSVSSLHRLNAATYNRLQASSNGSIRVNGGGSRSTSSSRLLSSSSSSLRGLNRQPTDSRASSPSLSSSSIRRRRRRN